MSDWMRKPRVWPRLARAWLKSRGYARRRLLPRGRPGRGELANIPASDGSHPRALPGEVSSASG